MMNYRSFSQTILTGRLGQDAKLVQTKSGTKMVTFGVCTAVSVKDPNGQYVQKTSWHDCLFAGSRCEKMLPLLTKGTLVNCQGQISYREVELANGYKGKTATIWVDDVQILALSKNAAEAQTQSSASAQTSKPVAQPKPAAEPAKPQNPAPAPQPAAKAAGAAIDDLEEDIPF